MWRLKFEIRSSGVKNSTLVQDGRLVASQFLGTSHALASSSFQPLRLLISRCFSQLVDWCGSAAHCNITVPGQRLATVGPDHLPELRSISNWPATFRLGGVRLSVACRVVFPFCFSSPGRPMYCCPIWAD